MKVKVMQPVVAERMIESSAGYVAAPPPMPHETLRTAGLADARRRGAVALPVNDFITSIC
jgi:hypothetical protein